MRLGASFSIITLSIIFHTILSYSIFDIWFVSPVVRVNERYSGPKSVAKRTVLIVGDGLRADSLFKEYSNPPFSNSDPLPWPLPNSPHALISDSSTKTTPAPYLRGLISSGNAKWGISHTQVPTESRPGHVALLCGMYEDVSAVFRGWKSNPVAVDSVANQSSHTFAFGSPDIVQMFKDGAEVGKVDASQYNSEFEDFTRDATELDIYVLDRLKELFANATMDPAVDTQLRQNRTFFFLHLLSLDSTGHSFRPSSQEYHRAIRVVDFVVEQVVSLFQEFYGDDETAFVFTADHGMSTVGNHGDGHPDNTRTPIIAFGAGVGRELEKEVDLDDYSRDWGLGGVRRDMAQADVAPLISILGGFGIPSNSVGRLPVSYLDGSDNNKSLSALANVKQILATFTTKRDIKKARSVNYRPFPPFATIPLEDRVTKIEELIGEGKYEVAIKQSLDLINLGVQGIEFFQKYDWFLLQVLVIAGYTGFMAFVLDFVIRSHVFTTLAPATVTYTSLAIQVIGFALFSAVSIKFVIEEAPATYFLYSVFPYAFWTSLLKDTAAIKSLITSSFNFGSVLRAILAFITLQLIVFGYTNRLVFTVMLVSIAMVWPLTMSKDFRTKNAQLLIFWAIICSGLSVFPSLPVEIEENLYIILSGGVIFLSLGFTSTRYLNDTVSSKSSIPKTASLARKIIYFQMVLLSSAMIVTYNSARRLQLKQGLPVPNQLAGWTILIISFLAPFIQGRVKQPPFERLAPLLLSFTPAFVILSLSYEGLFFSFFTLTLVLWLIIESKLSDESGMIGSKEKKTAKGDSKVIQPVKLGAEHLRISIFFLVFLHVAFFGVGNVASISSFFLEPVFRLIPRFHPFPMATLLLFKLLIPFMTLSAIFSLLNSRLKLPKSALFLIVLILSDILTINFFLRVKDHGSWLEIGSSISHHMICSFLSVFNSLLFLLGDTLMSNL